MLKKQRDRQESPGWRRENGILFTVRPEGVSQSPVVHKAHQPGSSGSQLGYWHSSTLLSIDKIPVVILGDQAD